MPSWMTTSEEYSEAIKARGWGLMASLLSSGPLAVAGREVRLIERSSGPLSLS